MSARINVAVLAAETGWADAQARSVPRVSELLADVYISLFALFFRGPAARGALPGCSACGGSPVQLRVFAVRDRLRFDACLVMRRDALGHCHHRNPELACGLGLSSLGAAN